MGEANARVTGSAFDYGAARFKQTALLGILDDVEGGAVFDGAAWVLELGLA